jgi:hypothetical protein
MSTYTVDGSSSCGKKQKTLSKMTDTKENDTITGLEEEASDSRLFSRSNAVAAVGGLNASPHPFTLIQLLC